VRDGPRLGRRDRRLFNDWVGLHEYGHYAQDKIGVLSSTGGAHDGCIHTGGMTPQNPFAEAWASAFANATERRNPGAINGDRARDFPPECQDLPSGTPGDAVENYVWGALFDLIDQNNEAGDSFSRFDIVGGSTLERLLVELVDRELDAADRGMLDFRRALIDRGIDQGRLDELLRHNRVLAPLPPPPPADPVEPIEPPDEGPLYCNSKPWMCE
jgi:hypothetical protein